MSKHRLQWTPRSTSKKLSKSFFFNPDSPRIANLIIKKVNSNIFITLCDLQKNVIISKSSGTIRYLGSTKKRKISPQAVEGIMRSLKKYFILYNIKALNLCLKISKCAHLFVLLKELRLFSIQVISIIDIKRVPHNGMRVRKMRRI